MIDAAEKALAIWESTLYTAVDAAVEAVLETAKQAAEARGIEFGEALGEARGMKLGKSEGSLLEARRIAKAMLQDGLDIELIARFTNLTIAEIKQLA